MVERLARLTAVTAAVLGVVLLIGASLSSDVQPDADAYWLAAQRLREGLPLYGGAGREETEIYRYAPWFAFAWVPLTYLSQEAAYVVWRGMLMLATLAAVWPLVRRPTPAAVTLALLLGGVLISSLPSANVTPLVVGMLTVGLRSRVGPIVLGLAASLKFFPLLLVAGFVAERRWLAAAVSIGVASLLWLNILAFDILLYTQIGGPSFYVGGISLYAVSPVVWLVVAGATIVVILGLTLARSRWTWLASAAAVPLAVPRVWLPDTGYLLAGVAQMQDSADRTDSSAPKGTT